MGTLRNELRNSLKDTYRPPPGHYIATAAALGRNKNKPHQERINTEVLLDPGTREEIIEDMQDAIDRHEGWQGDKAKKVWEQFKLNAFATLKRLTKKKKSESEDQHTTTTSPDYR